MSEESRIATGLKRGLRLRCPHCGEGRLFGGFLKVQGCAACGQTGYRGRAAIAEFLEMTPDIERLVFARQDQAAIERAAAAGGMQSLLEAGIAAALAGVTTIEDVVRSVRADG